MGFSFLKREVIRQFVRFCMVGLASATLTYLVYIVFLNFLRINYLISATLGVIFGVFFGFWFNRSLTFDSKKRVTITIPKYFLVYAISWAFNMITLRFLVETKKFNPIIANLLIIPLIALINFFGIKIFAFQNKKW